MSITQVMNSSISIVTNCKHQTTYPPETGKMFEVEYPLDSLLTRFSQSRISLEKPCDDNLFLALMFKIPRFDNAAPFFRLTQPEIEAIHRDYDSEKSRRLHMLWKWRRKNGSDATYLALVTVFLQMDDKYLAEFVMQHTKRTVIIEPIDSQLNPERSAKYRNWDRMSKAEREQVKNDLTSQNCEVRHKYAYLTLRILQSFEKRNVTVPKLKIFLQCFGIPRHTSGEPLVPNTLLPHFESDSSLEDMFLTLSRYYSSWFNIQLLKAIVNGELGCVDDQREVTKYEQELLSYLQRSIFEIPSKSFAQGQEDDSARHLYVRLPDGNPTGHDVYHLQSTISKHLGISEGILQFIGFEEGSIMLIFRIPEALLELQTSVKRHITFDPVKNVYNFNNDDLKQIL